MRCACYLSVSLLVCRRVWGGAEHCGEFDLARVCASSLASPLPPPHAFLRLEGAPPLCGASSPHGAVAPPIGRLAVWTLSFTPNSYLRS